MRTGCGGGHRAALNQAHTMRQSVRTGPDHGRPRRSDSCSRPHAGNPATPAPARHSRPRGCEVDVPCAASFHGPPSRAGQRGPPPAAGAATLPGTPEAVPVRRTATQEIGTADARHARGRAAGRRAASPQTSHTRTRGPRAIRICSTASAASRSTRRDPTIRALISRCTERDDQETGSPPTRQDRIVATLPSPRPA